MNVAKKCNTIGSTMKNMKATPVMNSSGEAMPNRRTYLRSCSYSPVATNFQV